MGRTSKTNRNLARRGVMGSANSKKRTAALKICELELEEMTLGDKRKTLVWKRLMQYTLLRNRCGWFLTRYPNGYHDPHIKRINASQMYLITANRFMKKYIAEKSSREKEIKQKWI